MPNSEIMSMEGQLVGMPLAGPESFSQQQLDYLKRALGVDETVLWEGSYTTGTAIQMSEAFANFDEVKVFYKSNDNVSSVFRFSPADNTLPYLNLFSYWVPSAKNSLSVKGAMFTLTSDTIVFTRGISGNTPGTITEASPITITRVVGIHRIAGGN